MRVVFDTNIFCADYRLGGNAFRVLTESASRVGISVLVPRLVFEEVINKHREHLATAARSLSKTQRDYERLTGENVRLQLSDENLDAKNREYRSYLEERLKALETEFLDYPAVSHEDLVKRCLRRRKPFSQDGRGYRDSLIWTTILELVRKGDGPVVFVTSNTNDFGEGESLHPELVQDLESIGAKPDAVRILPSLDHFNQDAILPKLNTLDEMADMLEHEQFPHFSLRSWAVRELIHPLRDQDCGELLVPLEPGHASVYISRIEDVQLLYVDDARLLPEGDYLISGRAQLKFKLSVDTDWERFTQFQDVWKFFGPDAEPFDLISMDHCTAATVLFSSVLDGKSYRVLATEIDEVEGEGGKLELSPHFRTRTAKGGSAERTS